MKRLTILSQIKADDAGFLNCLLTAMLALPFLYATPLSAQEQVQKVAPESDSAAEESEASDEDAAPDSLGVQALLDEDTTADMHDDSTILRDIGVASVDERGLLIFDTLRFWVGGAVQYDYYNLDDIYTNQSSNSSREGTNFRRLEGIFRSQISDWGEAKVQYDFNEGIFRDLYLRWVSKLTDTPTTITLGNQKEPMGLDYLSGTKFGLAQERSAPTHAFGSRRGLGVRLHRSFKLQPSERVFDFWEEDSTFMTTSVGVFTKDIEENNDTDLSVTGRVTAGRTQGKRGQHVGFSLSYREGDFFRVSMRPELREADRVTLARPEANTGHIVGLEAAFNEGRLYAQAEGFAAAYRGRNDGAGGGAYLQSGWFLTENSRIYQPKWGTIRSGVGGQRLVADVFGRISHTYGEDDISGSNSYTSLTIGSNLYYRQLRGSINILYGTSRETINDEDSGMAFNIRAQYIF
ncbi:MAG: porin [Halieaceae bacterium]